MRCPCCKNKSLSETELLPGLVAKTCDGCRGTWFERKDYESWRSRQSADLPETAAPQTVFMSAQVPKPKLCPACRNFLLPYRVGHGLGFGIDYCAACGGIWCDPGEWEAIHAKNLHDNLHEIVSQQWQRDVRQENIRTQIEESFRKSLGPDYQRAADVRNWLREHSNRDLLLSYLRDEATRKT